MTDQITTRAAVSARGNCYWVASRDPALMLYGYGCTADEAIRALLNEEEIRSANTHDAIVEAYIAGEPPNWFHISNAELLADILEAWPDATGDREALGDACRRARERYAE